MSVTGEQAGPQALKKWEGRVLLVYRLLWPGTVTSGAGDPHSGKGEMGNGERVGR